MIPLFALEPITDWEVLSSHFEMSFVDPIKVALKRISVPQVQVVWPRRAYWCWEESPRQYSIHIPAVNLPGILKHQFKVLNVVKLYTLKEEKG